MSATKNKRGFFITFEGPEGAGKSSQLTRLAEHLRSRGVNCLTTREPGGTPLAESIRSVVKTHRGSEKVHPETELLLIEAARAQHVAEVIKPALANGATVLCDRFYDSTTAYQGGARHMDAATIKMLNHFASAGCAPDLTLILDIAPERGFERTRGRCETRGKFDRFEAENLDFHRLVRQAFLELAQLEPKRIKVVDADRSPDEIAAEIGKIIDEFVF